MGDFKEFAEKVNNQFTYMAENTILCRTNFDSEEIITTYLRAFPEGTNPVYITNTEHDCTCCKNFIRNVGNLVGIKNGQLYTVWDIKIKGHYQVVADTIRKYVLSLPIQGIFFATEKKYGEYETKQVLENGSTIDWNHFNCKIPVTLYKGDQVGELAGKATTEANMLSNSLELFTYDSIKRVEELILNNSIYRGEEHLQSVKNFKELFLKFTSYKGSTKLFGLENYKNPSARFKNSVIGTLVEDLSKGVDLELAVKSFETKVAPSNYKRSKSLITQGMIDSAMSTIQELNLESTLKRRHATIHDVNINDVLYADHSVKPEMKNSISDLLTASIKPKKLSTNNSTDIQIKEFLADILPQAQSIEALIENRHQSNFMNIIAPVNESSNMFKWNNNFTWSYNGNVTDSMKEVVKEFGGEVDGKLRCSLMWNENNDNPNDLDLHCYSPYGHIFFGNKGWSTFNLDVDIQNPENKIAIENIIHSHSIMKQGTYKFIVNNYYTSRGATSGFKAEIEFNGEIFEYSYPKPLKNKEDVKVATVTVDSNNVMSIVHHLQPSSTNREIYNVTTNSFVKVNNIMLSPNHWSGQQGNKHYMFILEECKTKENVRGFYNEFLSNDLIKHRKVFEILASKTKVKPVDEQLAGLGFSSTIENSLTVKVSTDTSTRLYNIKF